MEKKKACLMCILIRDKIIKETENMWNMNRLK